MSDAFSNEFSGQDSASANRDGSVANGAANGLHGLRDSARMTTDALCDAGYKASAAMKEIGDKAYQFGGDAGARVIREVEARPVTAALVAASLGLIVGMLLPRR